MIHRGVKIGNLSTPRSDVILLGSGLGGLIGGTLLCQKGCSVLLLREKDYQPLYERERYRFVPFSNFSERRFNPSLLHWLSRELNLPALVSSQEKPWQKDVGVDSTNPKVAFQVVLPESRIDRFYERSRFQREWQREFPKEAIEVAQFFEKMDQLNRSLQQERGEKGIRFFSAWNVHSFFRRWSSSERPLDLSSFSREFKAFIHLQLIVCGNLLDHRFPTSLAAYLLMNDEPGEVSCKLDLEDLKERILDEFLRRGGRVEEIDGVQEMKRHWRKGFRIVSRGDGKEFASRFLILNSPLHRLTNLRSEGDRRILKQEARIRPRYVWVPLFLGVREQVIPVGMKDLLVSVQDLDKPYALGNILLINLSPEGDETQSPEGRRAMTVQSLVPLRALDEISLMENREAVIGHLRRLIPFLDDHIEFIDVNWAREQIYRGAHWSYPHFLYETPSDFRWREGVLPPRIAKDLYVTGKENFPYLGLEGEALGGWMAAEHLSKKLR